MNILIIEDDRVLAKNIVQVIEKNIISNIVHVQYSYYDFLFVIGNIHIYDIVILDIFLSESGGKTGIDILHILRKKNPSIPVIVMSNHSQYSLLEQAFDSGASDYMIKPFRLQELCIRIKKWYRVYLFTQYYSQESILNYYELSFFISKNQFFYKGIQLHLTKTQTYLLLLFMTHQEQLLSISYLEDKLLGGVKDVIQVKNIRIAIMRLKAKLKEIGIHTWIQNIHSQGYILKKIV